MRYACFGLLVLMLAGCNQVTPPIEGRADPYPASQINLASQDLRDKTAISPPIVDRRNGILFVTVPIRSASNYDLHIDYRVTFFSTNGSILYQGPWEPMQTLIHNVPSELRFNSTTSEAADWRLDLRYSR
ncbi:MAG: hypothetical protein ABSH20_00960 [Tepidisphaeraceae bacterium]|jgi:hypothetical protein